MPNTHVDVFKMGTDRRRCAGRIVRPVQPGPFDLSHAAAGSQAKKKTNRPKLSSSSGSQLDPVWGSATPRLLSPPVVAGPHPRRSSSSPPDPHPRRPSSSPIPALAARPRRQSPPSPAVHVASSHATTPPALQLLTATVVARPPPLAIDARCRKLCRRRPSVNQRHLEWM